MTASSASGPWRRSIPPTCCQRKRKRTKSCVDTGSISARRRCTVARWMRASSVRSHHSTCTAPGVNEPCSATPSAARLANTPARSAGARPRLSASASAVTGPRPSSRLRTISTSASSRDQDRRVNSAGASMPGSLCIAGKAAANCGSRSAAIHIGAADSPRASSTTRVARRACASAVSHGIQPDPASASACVTNANPSRPSCISSTSTGCGQASARTRSMAAPSRRPRSAAEASSSQRRAATACARRSSSGASSRYAYGRAVRISRASGDGAVRSRATTSTSPRSIPRSSASSPSTSIASYRQSCIAWRTSG